MNPLLEVEDLRVHFPVRSAWVGRRGTVRALDGVSISVASGEIVGLVGESGSGKTTLGRAILRLQPATAGVVRFAGRDITRLSGRRLAPVRRRMQAVFQDPSSSLNPAMTVSETLAEALDIHRIGVRSERPDRVRQLLDRVGLPAAVAARWPRELSGGQRQRVGIARALAVGPELIVADEAVSALDVSVQAQIVNLLQDLQAELGLAVLFIGHDLALVDHLCSRVAVLYLGKLMEIGPTAEVFARPRHPYTRALIDSAPVVDPLARRPRAPLVGDVASPLSPPSGCVFRTRCAHAIAGCAEVEPPLAEVGEAHAAACLRQAELAL